MRSYFLALAAAEFHDRLRPLLAESQRRRRLDVCLPLRDALAQRLQAFADLGVLRSDEALLNQVTSGLAFSKDLWRYLVDEVLLCAAVEMPDLQYSPAVLCRLFGSTLSTKHDRANFTAIEQVLYGSADLTFGAAYYRPDVVGWNDSADVGRLLRILETVRPDDWEIDSLNGLAGLEDEEDRADELAFNQEWFPSLVDLYQRAAANDWIIVCERPAE